MKEIIDYLSLLEQHNNREWYHAQKPAYQRANAAFLRTVQDLIFEIGKTDGSILHNEPKSLTFKLVRDTRFSADKSPYNPAFRAHIGPNGKAPIPVGYYIMIRPNNGSFLGGGLFADLFKDATMMIRDYIAANGAQWEAVIGDPVFRKYFSVKGTALKNIPRGYDAEHPQAEFLKHKSWYVETAISDAQLCSEAFLSVATERFLAMRPLNTFLNRALTAFELPKRP